MSDTYKVYKHTCPNGKVYIGITSQRVSRRWRNGEGYKDSPLFYNAVQKYGWENILHEVLLDGLTYSEAEEWERRLIDQYSSNDRGHGYNIESGGGSGKHLSDDTKKKISEFHKGKGNAWALKKYRETNDPWNKGKNGLYSHSDEWKQKMSERNSGENNPFYGKHHSSESVQKRLDHWKPLRGKEHPTSRAVCQYTIDGVLVRMWESLNEIEQSLHLLKTNICKCCRGKRNVCGGYVWKYAEDGGDANGYEETI